MKYELVRNGYGDPCAVRQGDTVLHFTTDGKEIVDALDKAALFDWLAARVEAGAWIIEAINGAITIDNIERFQMTADSYGSVASPIGSGPTLAEAIEAAMRAEGEAK